MEAKKNLSVVAKKTYLDRPKSPLQIIIKSFKSLSPKRSNYISLFEDTSLELTEESIETGLPLNPHNTKLDSIYEFKNTARKYLDESHQYMVLASKKLLEKSEFADLHRISAKMFLKQSIANARLGIEQIKNAIELTKDDKIEQELNCQLYQKLKEVLEDAICQIEYLEGKP